MADENNPLTTLAKAALGFQEPEQNAPETQQEQPVTQTQEAPTETDPAPAEVPNTEASTEEVAQEEEDVDVTVEADANSALYAHITGGQPQTIKVPKRTTDWLIKNGYDVKEVVNLKRDKERYAVVEKERDEYKGQIDQIAQVSPELKEALRKELAGDHSWKKDIARTAGLNFAKPVQEQSKKVLLDTFLPGKVSEEQWKEYTDVDGDARDKAFVETMLETASDRYNAEQASFTARSQQQREAAEAWQKNWNDSTKASREA